MSDPVICPPTWAKSIFYLLIVVVLIICVVSFILKASFLSSDFGPQSISYVIATFGVGLSLICGMLWIGGVLGVMNIPKEIQKALWVTLITAVLSITVTVYKSFFSSTKVYKVTGIVAKADGEKPMDIVISPKFPPLYPVPSAQENIALEVQQDSKGRFPNLAFSHPAYVTEPVDLNDRTKVEFKNDMLRIINKIELKPSPR